MADLVAQTSPEDVSVDREWADHRAAWLVTHDYTALRRLARQGDALVLRDHLRRRLVPLRIAIASNATTDFVVPVLRGALRATGIEPVLATSGYGQLASSLIDPAGPLTSFGPRILVVLNTTADVAPWPGLFDSAVQVDRLIDEACRRIFDPIGSFHERTGAEVIINTVPPPAARALGNLGSKLPGDPINFVRRLNVALGDRAPAFVHVSDLALLGEREGLDRWFDERVWHEAKQPMALDSVGEYARNVAAIVGAVLGRAKKCLVLDLDNTLWGGVIGDDGLGGIVLGQGSAAGEAFLAFQRYVKQLKERGVLLAVSSKNDERIARTPFSDHPEIVLRLEDFVAFKANWHSKSENIQIIARELDLPLEAFVFADDNPAERAEVARALPEVTVLPMPDDPSEFVRTLDRARLFETTTLTAEDVGRSAAYQARRQTLEARGGATDLDGYLASLAMHARIGPFDEVSIERITQLINKTNQFNLTTPRLVQAEVRRIAADPDCLTCQVRLGDRFADHGLISVAVGRIAGDGLVLDTWLMSCRVLGRGVERLVHNYWIEAARHRGLTRITGSFVPTGRNELVKDHYRLLGFEPVGTRGATTDWQLRVSMAAPLPHHITLDRDEETSR